MTPFEQLPPHDIEAEEAVIAVAMKHPGALVDMAPMLVPADFFREKNGWIWTAILDLYHRGEKPRIEAVARFLAGRDQLEEAGGQTYLRDVLGRLLSTDSGLFHAEIVKSKARLREIIAKADGIKWQAYRAEDPDVVIDNGTASFIAMGGQRSNQLTYTAAEAMKGTDGNPGVVERIETRLAEPEYTEGYRFGWPELEALVGGLVPGHLIVVMADTSVGKSAFVQNLAWQLAKAGKRSWIWSSEMDHIEVTQRITAMEAGLNIRAFDAENSPSPAQLHAIRAAEVSVASLPISIMPMARAQLKTVAAEARRQCSNGAEVVFLDHLQHLRVQGMQGTAMWEEIAAIVKEIAMLNRVPVVAVNHVNRDSAREGITMHSGKNSSAWEQDANDMIILETVAYEVGHWRTLTESETNAQLAEHRWVKVRARTPKVREGGLGYCVRVLDWNKGGRYVPLSEEYRG